MATGAESGLPHLFQEPRLPVGFGRVVGVRLEDPLEFAAFPGAVDRAGDIARFQRKTAGNLAIGLRNPVADDAGNAFQGHLGALAVFREDRFAPIHADLGMAALAEIAQGALGQIHQSGLVGEEGRADLRERVAGRGPFPIDLQMTAPAFLGGRKLGLVEQCCVALSSTDAAGFPAVPAVFSGGRMI